MPTVVENVTGVGKWSLPLFDRDFDELLLSPPHMIDLGSMVEYVRHTCLGCYIQLPGLAMVESQREDFLGGNVCTTDSQLYEGVVDGF